MLLIFLRFIFGYAKVEVIGYYPNRFMNMIISHEMVVWDVENTEKGYVFKTGRKNLYNMKPFLKDTNMKMHIMEQYGFPVWYKCHKKRVVFILGLLTSAVLLYVLSLFIWDITIEGETQLVKESIQKCIQEKYIPLGTLKKNIDCNELEEELRNEFAEISWISCSINGTRLIVALEEGILTEKMNHEMQPRDLVACKDAVITKMVTRNGTPVVKVNDSVKTGDILISGDVFIYDDNNEVLESNRIEADGDVFGNTNYDYEDFVELQYYDKIYSDNNNKIISFYFLRYSFSPFSFKNKKNQCDYCTTIHKFRIFEDFYLPFGYESTLCKEYSLEKKNRTEMEAKTILENRLRKKLTEFREKGVEIIQNDVKIKESNGKMIAKGSLLLNESITRIKNTRGKN